MGTFHVYIGIANPEGGDAEQVLAMVDTGATHTMVPATLLEYLHIRPLAQRTIHLADNRTELQPVGQASISYRGEEWVCPVVFGPEDQYLLGATTLEAFELAVDPLNKELVPVVRRARAF